MSLVNELIKGLLPEEEGKKTIGVFGGGFKPPTKGHFEVLKKALDENPEIDEMLVFVGKKERDGITQEESLKMWEIYGKYLPFKVRYIKSTKPPIQLIYNTAKENPESEVLWIIGAREENEDDFKDIASRTSGITKYPNLELRTIVTKGGVSGTAARNAAKVSKEKLDDFLPEFLSEKEKQDIFVMLSNTVTEINENASYSQHIDIWDKIDQLNTHMINKGMNIEPLPTVELINGDTENAKEFLGKTAYYDPNQKHIVLYTEGRHPKDIVRSYAHEMIHHIQNLEDRLGDVSGTNTMEDDHLDKIEQEANLRGTMTFRNWTDSILNEAIVGEKIECDKCGWSWNIVDGGDDLFICHKCGNDNTPITEETLFEEEDRLMVDVVNPDGERFEYEESNVRGLYTYEDSYNNLYFVRVFYNPLSTNPYFEFKTGWFKDNDISKPTYDPHLPPNTTGMDNLKRRNTVAKIYRDEILPFFIKNKFISNKLHIKPISHSRHTFSKRLIKNHTPKDFNIELKDDKIIVSLPKKINEKKTKDPFGINAYAMELGRLREDETEYQIYCDMDGVIADFERGYEELTGIDLQGEFKPEGEEFWDPISKAGVGFWAGLKWMPDGQQLWDYIKPHKPKLLSAPSREDSSRIGKHVWVKHKIPGTKLILRYASQKQELAEPNAILIDDREKNIEQWEAAGGIGILHTSAADTISQLKKLGL